MHLKHLNRLLIAALFVAWCYDQLFWNKAPGISFFIFCLLCLGAGVFLTWGERLKPPRTSLVLVLPILFFSGMTFFRREPFTLLVDYAAALGGLGVLALTWLGGRWWRYGLRDYLVNGARLAFSSLSQPAQIFFQRRKEAAQAAANLVRDGGVASPAAVSRKGAAALSLLFGLALALPVVIILAVLLANADPIFNRRLVEFLQLLNIQQLGEYLLRLVYICLLAYVLGGAYLYSLLSSREEKLAGSEKPWPPPFVGWIEAVTVLTSVDLLFAFFVVVQFQYFFGGQSNIRLEGFTYAEYARRGFGELVIVAVISLMLFLGLSLVTRRDKLRPRRIFSGLGVLLVGLVMVILASAFQRLLLYESAYGFSRLRAYTHVFMVWLGILLVVTAVLEGLGRLRGFTLAAILCGLGFGITLNTINVDAYITTQNIARSSWGAALDTAYLASLSEDAVPVLFGSLHSASLPPELKGAVGAALVCRKGFHPELDEDQPWPSYHWSRQRAARLYQVYQGELKAYSLKLADRTFQVLVNGIWKDCQSRFGD